MENTKNRSGGGQKSKSEIVPGPCLSDKMSPLSLTMVSSKNYSQVTLFASGSFKPVCPYPLKTLKRAKVPITYVHLPTE